MADHYSTPHQRVGRSRSSVSCVLSLSAESRDYWGVSPKVGFGWKQSSPDCYVSRTLPWQGELSGARTHKLPLTAPLAIQCSPIPRPYDGLNGILFGIVSQRTYRQALAGTADGLTISGASFVVLSRLPSLTWPGSAVASTESPIAGAGNPNSANCRARPPAVDSSRRNANSDHFGRYPIHGTSKVFQPPHSSHPVKC